MELCIHACEGGFYLAKLRDNTMLSEKTLRDTCKRHGIFFKSTMKFYSLAHIREFFEPLAPEYVWLIHNHAYDEMIGLSSSAAEHKQPLHWYSGSFTTARHAKTA